MYELLAYVIFCSRYTQNLFSNFSSASCNFRPRRAKMPPPNRVVESPSIVAKREGSLIESSTVKSWGLPRTVILMLTFVSRRCLGAIKILVPVGRESFLVLKPLSLKKASMFSVSKSRLTPSSIHLFCVFKAC